MFARSLGLRKENPKHQLELKQTWKCEVLRKTSKQQENDSRRPEFDLLDASGSDLPLSWTHTTSCVTQKSASMHYFWHICCPFIWNAFLMCLLLGQAWISFFLAPWISSLLITHSWFLEHPSWLLWRRWLTVKNLPSAKQQVTANIHFSSKMCIFN